MGKRSEQIGLSLLAILQIIAGPTVGYIAFGSEHWIMVAFCIYVTVLGLHSLVSLNTHEVRSQEEPQ